MNFNVFYWILPKSGSFDELDWPETSVNPGKTTGFSKIPLINPLSPLVWKAVGTPINPFLRLNVHFVHFVNKTDNSAVCRIPRHGF